MIRALHLTAPLFLFLLLRWVWLLGLRLVLRIFLILRVFAILLVVLLLVLVLLLRIGLLLLLVKAVGVGPVHCDMIMIVEPGIGLTTPPVGSVLFGGSAVGKLPIEKVVLALLPFFVLQLIVPMLVTRVPQLLLWLRRAVGV